MARAGKKAEFRGTRRFTGPGPKDGHTHQLLASGKTSRTGSNPHTHTWSRSGKRTSRNDGHTHSIPKSARSGAFS